MILLIPYMHMFTSSHSFMLNYLLTVRGGGWIFEVPLIGRIFGLEGHQRLGVGETLVWMGTLIRTGI